MSPKGLVALLLVGLCAAQTASAFRHSREVAMLMDTATEKLEGELANSKDAASSSMETVLGMMQKMESYALTTASEKLEKLGFPIDLFTLAELFKSNVNTCVTNDAFKAQAQAIIGEMSSCVSKDTESLKGLLENMHKLWSTASALPGSMVNVANQCSEHGKQDIPPTALDTSDKGEASDKDSDKDDDKENKDDDDDKHDLNPVIDQIKEEAAHSRDKRALWSISRIARCFKSVYSMAKSDLITIPGQILSAASNAYNVVKAATHGTTIPKCLQDKAEEVLPAIKAVSYEVSSCLSKFDLDAIMAANPKLARVKTMAEMALKFGSMPSSGLGALNGVASGGISGALGAIEAAKTGGITGALGALGAAKNGDATGAVDAVAGGVSKMFG